MHRDTLLLDPFYSREVSADLKVICSPLKEFGIIYFAFARTFYNGTAYFLSTHWESTYHHIINEYPLSKSIPQSEAGKKFHHLPFLSKTISPEEKKAFNAYRDLFNISHPIYFVERHKSYTDIYCYSAEANNAEIINFYLSNIDILEKFKFYLKDKAATILKKAEKCRFQLTEKMYVPFDEKINPNVNKNEIIKKIAPKNFILSLSNKDVPLTKREYDILKYIVKGCTIKEAAQYTNLSPRTVENYFNNVKAKMGFRSKSKIVQIISESDFF